MEAMLQGITQLGLAVALVVYFVYQGKKREDRMSAAIEKLEAFQQQELLENNKMLAGVIERNTAALAKVATAMQYCSRNGELRKGGNDAV